MSAPVATPAVGAGWAGGYLWRVTFVSHPGDFNDSLISVGSVDSAYISSNGLSPLLTNLSSGTPRAGAPSRAAQVQLSSPVP